MGQKLDTLKMLAFAVHLLGGIEGATPCVPRLQCFRQTFLRLDRELSEGLVRAIRSRVHRWPLVRRSDCIHGYYLKINSLRDNVFVDRILFLRFCNDQFSLFVREDGEINHSCSKFAQH